MSLKAFHIAFVVISTVFSFSLGVWFATAYGDSREAGALVLAAASFLGSAILVWYGFWVLKKLKGMSLL